MKQESENRVEADAIIEVARQAEANRAPIFSNINGLELLLHKDGRTESLEKYYAYPRRRRANVHLCEVASFIEYIKQQGTPRTALFGKASETGGSFTALIDYHAKYAGAASQSDEASWGEHRATLTLETTPEWKKWIENNGKLLTQEQFAEFIEDNLSDIIEPDSATILEIAQGLQGRKSVSFKSGKNLRDGSIQLEYVETIEVNGVANRRDDKFKVPEKFLLGIVPFLGAEGIEISARLRFRIGNGGALSFCYILDRPFKVVEQAFEIARSNIEAVTERVVMLGSAAIPSL